MTDPVKCIALSNFEYEQIIAEALEAGAIGYISKNAGRDEIAKAIQTIYDGCHYYCTRTTARMIKPISMSKYHSPEKKSSNRFASKKKAGKSAGCCF